MKLTKRIGTLFALSLLVLGLSATQAFAAPTTLTFEGHSNTIFGDEFLGNGFITASDNGYDFFSSGDHFHFIDIFGFGGPLGNGTGSLLEDRSYAITMTKNGGGTFSLNSLDAYSYQTDLDLTVTGYINGGGTISLTILGGFNAYAPTTSFVGFNNLDKVEFTPNAGSFGMDNVVVDDATTVPEPATAVVTLIGLALTGAVARKRKV